MTWSPHCVFCKEPVRLLEPLSYQVRTSNKGEAVILHRKCLDAIEAMRAGDKVMEQVEAPPQKRNDN